MWGNFMEEKNSLPSLPSHDTFDAWFFFDQNHFTKIFNI
jgi:hypothetical protein